MEKKNSFMVFILLLGEALLAASVVVFIWHRIWDWGLYWDPIKSKTIESRVVLFFTIFYTMFAGTVIGIVLKERAQNNREKKRDSFGLPQLIHYLVGAASFFLLYFVIRLNYESEEIGITVVFPVSFILYLAWRTVILIDNPSLDTTSIFKKMWRKIF